MSTASAVSVLPRDAASSRVSALDHLRARLAVMHPAYFALVMATGIVAIACHLFGLRELSRALAWLNWVAYPSLWIALLARAVLFRRQFLADWADHARAPGFFTLVAATGVLGTQAVLLHDALLVGRILWWGCVALWALCTYTIFALLTVRSVKPTLAEGINGGWLVAVVATQSVCVLGCTLNGTLLGDRETTLFLMMCFWLGGGMLYLWIIGLVFYRYMFFSFSPRDLMPPYWINMGAVAISTLAGALLAGAVDGTARLAPLRPFIVGLTAMFWATATWWIPLLVVLGIWRHRIRAFRLSYDPLYWGLVFPVGMYAVCTYRLSAVLSLPLLAWIARVFVVAATVVWLLTFLGLAQRILYTLLLALRGVLALRPARPPLIPVYPEYAGGTTHASV